MRANGRSETHEDEPRAFSPMNLMSEVVQQGTERFFGTQRILLDLIMRQNSMTMDAIRHALSTKKKEAEKPSFTELAAEGMSNFIAGTRVLLHFARQQNEVAMQGVRERVDGSAMASALTDILRRSVDTMVELQQKDWTLAAKQTEAWLKSIQSGEPYEGKGIPEIAKEALENFVHAQKAYLDILAEETVNATDRPKGYKPMGRTELSALAMQATHNFIDAQKKLLDVAAKQVDVNLKTVRRMVNLLPAIPRLDIGHLTRETVASFVDAQKAFIDVMVKPRRAAHVRHEEPPVEAKPARKRVSHRPKRVTV